MDLFYFQYMKAAQKALAKKDSPLLRSLKYMEKINTLISRLETYLDKNYESVDPDCKAIENVNRDCLNHVLKLDDTCLASNFSIKHFAYPFFSFSLAASYLKAKKAQMKSRENVALLNAISKAKIGIFKVLSADDLRGGVVLQDIHSGEIYTIYNQNLSLFYKQDRFPYISGVITHFRNLDLFDLYYLLPPYEKLTKAILEDYKNHPENVATLAFGIYYYANFDVEYSEEDLDI